MTAEVLGETGDWTAEEFAYLMDLAESAGYSVARDFPNVDREDLIQEALVWAVKHPGALKRFLGHEDEEQSAKLIHNSMRREARDFAVKQRALQRGDDTFIDDAFYSIEMLKGFGRGSGQYGLLHHVFDDEAWPSPEKREDTGVRTKKDPAEGNDWLATLSDVSAALDKLARNDAGAHSLLVLHFKQQYTYEQIGASLTPAVPKVTVSRRIDRAVKKLQEILGGPAPKKDPEEPGWENGLVGTRRVVTNAHARALTDGSWDE